MRTDMRGYTDEEKKPSGDPWKRPAKNNCYECGAEIDDNRHFCDQSCVDKFFDRYDSPYTAKFALAQITRSRKKKGKPCFVGYDSEVRCRSSASRMRKGDRTITIW
jgi:hypothetical protein